MTDSFTKRIAAQRFQSDNARRTTPLPTPREHAQGGVLTISAAQIAGARIKASDLRGTIITKQYTDRGRPISREAAFDHFISDPHRVMPQDLIDNPPEPRSFGEKIEDALKHVSYRYTDDGEVIHGFTVHANGTSVRHTSTAVREMVLKAACSFIAEELKGTQLWHSLSKRPQVEGSFTAFFETTIQPYSDPEGAPVRDGRGRGVVDALTHGSGSCTHHECSVEETGWILAQCRYSREYWDHHELESMRNTHHGMPAPLKPGGSPRAPAVVQDQYVETFDVHTIPADGRNGRAFIRSNDCVDERCAEQQTCQGSCRAYNADWFDGDRRHLSQDC